MGSFHQEYWQSVGAGQTRAERKSGAYMYYVPSNLNELDLQLDTDVVADIVRAEKALSMIESSNHGLVNFDALSRFLLRAEAISSSFIEGLHLGAKRLMQAELNQSDPTTFKKDVTAAEIVGNINALSAAIELAGTKSRIELDDICSIHNTLLMNTPSGQYAGKIRTVQNWVGGNSYNPLNAAYVPPPPALVGGLLDDLLNFINREDISPVQQAALSHAQLEAIHPFVDGNGRAGRALILLVLKRRGLLRGFVPPISLILATHSKSYIAGLNSIVFEGTEPSSSAAAEINEWLSFFSGSCVRAWDEVLTFSGKAKKLEEKWRVCLGAVRRHSALDLLLGRLVGLPVFTVNSASNMLARSYQATSFAVDRLVEAGIAKPLSGARRNKAFEVPEALDAFKAFEYQLGGLRTRHG